ncbi:MAG: aquaporin family protein [Bernardetiaceae bacterium]|jgi:glycerol uptake facilitator protein|nr:aquaporin family protein [Bernardetiaceae bacterium]
MSVYLAEFVGTMLLILLGNGVVANVSLARSKAQNGGWVVVALAWGLAVALAAYAVGRVSGAHLNPALTLALALIGNFGWGLVPGYVAAQLAGAFTGAALVMSYFKPHFEATADPATKLGVFCTGPAIRRPLANLFSEVLGTFVLVLGILAIGANQLAQGFNPLLVGLLVVTIGLALGGTTGYALNPARDLGPRLAHAWLPLPGKGGSDWAYAWVPVAGPVLGAAYGAVFYRTLFQATPPDAAFWLLSVLMISLWLGVWLEKPRS